MMKAILIFILSLLTLIDAKAQLIINAGNDTAICEGNTILLGSSPTASGGTPSYTYKWEMLYPIDSMINASFFLNDTTISNPSLISCIFSDNLIFRLTVSDEAMNIEFDTIIVRCSGFASWVVDNFANINPGDSVQLVHNFFGGIPPISYEWTPDYNLSNANTENPWAKPDVTTFYFCSVTDSIGCQSSYNSDIFEVYVNPLSVQELINFHNSLFIYPNPTKNLLNIVVPDAQALKIDVYTVDGKLIERKSIIKNTTVDVSKYQSGLYFINATNSKGEVFRNKFVKE